MDELKDAKAKAGSAVNRSPNLTGDIGTLGTPVQACTDSFHNVSLALPSTNPAERYLLSKCTCLWHLAANSWGCVCSAVQMCCADAAMCWGLCCRLMRCCGGAGE